MTTETLEVPRAAPAEPADCPLESLPVLIVHDDLPAFRRALRVLVNVTDQLNERLDLQPLPWRFDDLECSELRAQAKEEAGRAEIMVISSSAGKSLSSNVRQWIRACCTPHDAPGLLVALLGSAAGTHPAAVSEVAFLRALAETAGMTFLTPQAGNVSCPAAAPDCVPAVA